MLYEHPNPITNPNYGKGIFRRRIRLEKRGQLIAAGLEDTLHACKMVLQHDGRVITAIDGTWYRHPNMTCRTAIDQFAPFIGKPLTPDRAAFRDYVEPRQQCTHFLDLIRLTLAHALRDETVRQFDIAVPDLAGESTSASVQVNGALVHEWRINTEIVVAPEAFGGKPLTSGFTRWASEAFSGDALEAAHVLQRGIFVSWSTYLNFKAMAARDPGKVMVPAKLLGACHALQPERVDQALPCHDVRDFTDCPEKMLLFL